MCFAATAAAVRHYCKLHLLHTSVHVHFRVVGSDCYDVHVDDRTPHAAAAAAATSLQASVALTTSPRG
jgi:hypothetical protein